MDKVKACFLLDVLVIKPFMRYHHLGLPCLKKLRHQLKKVGNYPCSKWKHAEEVEEIASRPCVKTRLLNVWRSNLQMREMDIFWHFYRTANQFGEAQSIIGMCFAHIVSVDLLVL